ncbi:MAG: hypothetical protein ACJ79K_12395 [Gemmatimonadaceae bacterium]
MDLRELDGRTVVGVLFQSEATKVGYIRGVAAWNDGELGVISEEGQVYPVPASFASVAQPVTESIREAAPAAMQILLAAAEFILPIPPLSSGNIALAVTPGWSRRPSPNDR